MIQADWPNHRSDGTFTKALKQTARIKGQLWSTSSRFWMCCYGASELKSLMWGRNWSEFSLTISDVANIRSWLSTLRGFHGFTKTLKNPPNDVNRYSCPAYLQYSFQSLPGVMPRVAFPYPQNLDMRHRKTWERRGRKPALRSKHLQKHHVGQSIVGK